MQAIEEETDSQVADNQFSNQNSATKLNSDLEVYNDRQQQLQDMLQKQEELLALV